MKLVEACMKLGPDLALEVFQRAGALDQVTFEEWIETSEACADRHYNDMGHSAAGFGDEVMVARVCLLAKSFDDHLKVLVVMDKNPGFRRDRSVVLGASHGVYERLVEQADTFDHVKTAYKKLNCAHYNCEPCPGPNRQEVLAEVLRERASHLATTFDEWLWIAKAYGHPMNDARRRLAIEKMRNLAVSLEQWTTLMNTLIHWDHGLETIKNEIYGKLIEFVVEKST